MSRKLLIFWMLMAAPLLQARTLMHCEMMGEVAMTAECCCEGGETEMATPGGDETCCEVVAVTDALPDGVKTAFVDEEFDAYQAQAPPARMPTVLAAPRTVLPRGKPLPHTTAAKPLWLTTARLRL